MKKIISLSIFLLLFFIATPALSKRIPGPGKSEFDLEAHKKRDILFELDDTTTTIIGMGIGSYVDYFLYDPNKNLVSWDTSPGTTCYIRYEAFQAGSHVLKVKNYGDESSHIIVRIQ
jgi:hypothetical protein